MTLSIKYTAMRTRVNKKTTTDFADLLPQIVDLNIKRFFDLLHSERKGGMALSWTILYPTNITVPETLYALIYLSMLEVKRFAILERCRHFWS